MFILVSVLVRLVHADQKCIWTKISPLFLKFVFANISVEGCLTNMSCEIFHKFAKIFILKIVNLLRECLVLSSGTARKVFKKFQLRRRKEAGRDRVRQLFDRTTYEIP